MTQCSMGHPDRLPHRAQGRPVHTPLREQGDRALQDLLSASHPFWIRATPWRAASKTSNALVQQQPVGPRFDRLADLRAERDEGPHALMGMTRRVAGKDEACG